MRGSEESQQMESTMTSVKLLLGVQDHLIVKLSRDELLISI